MKYPDRITIEPGKRSGKPCIRGMPINVYDVVSYLASGMTYLIITTQSKSDNGNKSTISKNFDRCWNELTLTTMSMMSEIYLDSEIPA